MRTTLDYWKECISHAADECGLSLTAEQIDTMATAVQVGHENYHMAFYSPPSTDRLKEMEKEYNKILIAKEIELETFKAKSNLALKKALNQYDDVNLVVGEHGEVYRCGGRTEQIQ